MTGTSGAAEELTGRGDNKEGEERGARPAFPPLSSVPRQNGVGGRYGLEERRPGCAAHVPGTGRLLRVKATATTFPGSLPSARGLRKCDTGQVRVAVTGGLRGEQSALAVGV